MPNLEPKIPGVFLNYLIPTPEPELLTGIPVFFGLASLKEKEGVNEPKKLTLANHFQQYFHPPTEPLTGYLEDAIKGFFENGGRLCYVIALADNSLKALQQGLEISEVLDNIDLVCVPDVMLGSNPQTFQMQQAVLEHCDRMGDRFAILDAMNDVSNLEAQLHEFSSHNGALYAPWLIVEHRNDAIPPCGHIAGVYASCDRTTGVHGAPANIPLQGVLDFSFSATLTHQAQLNPKIGSAINFIRSFQGRGMRVWGVRTLSPISEWQFINVRRLFITFRRWANRNLADTVFEPNAFPLWVRLKRELSVYCESLWRQGAIQGAVSQEAFYVKCDAETNPPENRDVGQVIAEIGLAPIIPGEFIKLLLIQNSSGISLT